MGTEWQNAEVVVIVLVLRVSVVRPGQGVNSKRVSVFPLRPPTPARQPHGEQQVCVSYFNHTHGMVNSKTIARRERVQRRLYLN